MIVLRKELKETLRDRRTLLVMIIVPVLLYPTILIVAEQLLLFGRGNLDAETSPIALVGSVPEELQARVRLEPTLRGVSIDPVDPESAIRVDSVGAVGVVGPSNGSEGSRSVTVLFDPTSDRSSRARDRLSDVLEEWREDVLRDRLDARGLPESFATPIALSDSSVASAQEVGGYALGMALPLLLIVITLLGAFYPAIDLAAGEKERGTLETLLTAPVAPHHVVMGKFMAVALIGVVAAGLNLASMLLTLQTGVLQVTAALGLEVSISLGAVVAIFVTLVPLAVFFAAVFLGVSVRAASFKEAQNALTPLYMLVLIPAMLPLFPGIDFTLWTAVTPVAGVAFFFRDVMASEVDLLLAGVVLLSTVAYAGMALWFATRAFGSERVLFGSFQGEEPPALGYWARIRDRGREGVTPTRESALVFVALVAVLFFWVGIALQVGFGERGALASEWLLLFLPVVVFVGARGYDVRATLSLRRPSGAALVGAVVLILGTMPLVWTIGWLQTFIFPVPWEMLEGLEDLVTADSVGRFLWLMLLVAVTPAVCEEVVFRGVLLSGSRDLSPWRMVALNGVVFGAFHLSFETVVRFLPTALLGSVIAWSVWRSRSLWVGCLMHFINNGAIVLLVSIPWLREWFSDPTAPPPLWLVPLGAILCVLGGRLLLREVPLDPSHASPTSSRTE